MKPGARPVMPAASAMVGLAAALLVTPAHATTLNAQGKLVFDTGALFTLGVESPSDGQGAGAAWLT